MARWLSVGKGEPYRIGSSAMKRMIRLTRKLHRHHQVSVKAESRRRARPEFTGLQPISRPKRRQLFSVPSRTLVLRYSYGGRKGHRAYRRLLRMRISEVIAGGVMLDIRPKAADD